MSTGEKGENANTERLEAHRMRCEKLKQGYKLFFLCYWVDNTILDKNLHEDEEAKGPITTGQSNKRQRCSR
jgi:hypothetical protein